VLGWAVLQLDVPWHDVRWLGVVSGVFAGAAVFYGLFILQATLAFWTVESLEVMNTMTYGGVEVAQYPMSIYRPWFRTFFTLVVPLACTSYFPVRSLLLPSAGPDAFLQTCLPLGIGALFLGVTLRLWSVGVRHYRSTGS
jgi:ABC-2 type transport system permease protein